MVGMRCLYTKLDGMPHNSLGAMAGDGWMHRWTDSQTDVRHTDGHGAFQDSPPEAQW